MINDPTVLRKSASGKERSRNESDQPLVIVVDDDAAVREAVQS